MRGPPHHDRNSRRALGDLRRDHRDLADPLARLDDDPSPVGDKEVERNILDIFARRDIPLCVAAIPFARTADGGTILLSRQNASHLVDASREGTIEIFGGPAA